MKIMESLRTLNMMKKIFTANTNGRLIANAKQHLGLSSIWKAKIEQPVDLPGEDKEPLYFVADKVSETEVDISLYTQQQIIEALRSYSPVGRTRVSFTKPTDFRYLSKGRYVVDSDDGVTNAAQHFIHQITKEDGPYIHPRVYGSAPSRYPAFVELKIGSGDNVVVERVMAIGEMENILAKLDSEETR